MIDKVRGGLRHVPAIAGRANPAPLARERDDKPLAAARAEGTAEPKAEDAALEIPDLGGWRERIAPGAFATALRATDFPILALYDHTIGSVLGSTANGTLRLTEDTKGLRFALDLPDTSAGRDVVALVRRGDVAGASFGFTVSKRGSEWMKGTGGVPVKVVREVKALREISVVALPAYPAAYTMAAATKPETPTQARCREAVEKMRRAVAAAG